LTKPASRWLVTVAGGMLGRELDVSAWILNLAILIAAHRLNTEP
jgi:hypothetical protein